MSNHDIAEKISNMNQPDRTKVKSSLIGLILKCLGGISLLIAVGLFLAMQEQQTEIDRFVQEGTVSNGLILDKNMSTTTLKNKKGQTRSYEKEMLYVTYDPQSKVKYSNLGNKWKEADLPPAAQPDAEQSNTASLSLSEEEYAKANVGATALVVRTPYGDTQLVSEIRAYSASSSLMWMAIFGALAVVLWLAGRRFGK